MRLHHRTADRRRCSVAIGGAMGGDQTHYLSVHADPTSLRRHSLTELRPGDEGALLGLQGRRNSSANSLCTPHVNGRRPSDSSVGVGGPMPVNSTGGCTLIAPPPSPHPVGIRKRSAVSDKKPPLRRFDTSSSLEISYPKIFSVLLIIVLMILLMGVASLLLRRCL